MVRGSNSTAAFLHISQNIIAQRIISLFNGRSLGLPKRVHFEILRSQFRKNQKNKTKKKKKRKKEPQKKQHFGNLGNSVAIFQESRNIVFSVSFVFFGFSWIGFAGIWRLASFLCYTTVEFISLIELSILRNFYYSWQLLPNLLGLVLVLCFLFA